MSLNKNKASASDYDFAPVTLSKRRCNFDKRHRQPAIPLNLKSYLTFDQLAALRELDVFGWRLVFIRRRREDNILPVVYSSLDNRYGYLEKDGSINTTDPLVIRPY